MKKGLSLIFFLLCFGGLLNAQSFKGISILKLKSNRGGEPFFAELNLSTSKILENKAILTYSEGTTTLEVTINEDESIELNMKIKGRPFSGYLTHATWGVELLEKDNSFYIFFKERFSMGASTMSVPTAYYFEPGSYIGFYEPTTVVKP